MNTETFSFDFHEFMALFEALATPTALMGFAVLLGCLALSWLVVSVTFRKVQHPATSVLFGTHVVDGVLFPVLALGLAFIAKRALPAFGVSPAVFKLAIPVLLSLVMIRLTVRVLSAALPASNWIKLMERTVSWLAWGALSSG